MDQSLRTVATQLLNVTGPQDVMKVTGSKEHVKFEHNLAFKSPEKPSEALIRKVNSEISNLESMGVSFGRPMNSKFGYFESSHPGQAMAMTEEELEREMSTTRLITAYKNHPTTTGGISTWILLNPPSTTVKSVEFDRTKLKQPPFQTEVRLTVRPSSSGSVERIETIAQSDKVAEKTTVPLITPVITTEKVNVITKKPTATTLKKIMTTTQPESITQDQEKAELTTLKIVRVTTVSIPSDAAAFSSTTAATMKKNQGTRATSKPKVTTPRTTKPGITKPTRSGQHGKPKPTVTRRTTVKLETAKNESASTGKIEKVTFKPAQIITTTQKKPDNTERPMFVTKIKASVLTDTQKVTTSPLLATTTSPLITSKSNLSSADLVEVPVRLKPIGTKGSNVLKVQLKKPAEDSTRIEVEPIKMNAPVLKIQKVDRDKMDEIVKKDTEELSNSRIDLKFDFNPELTKINIETQTESPPPPTTTTTTTTAASSTTKRPRHNSKRKKNKGRRRKPSTTTVATPSMVVATASMLTEANDESAIEIAADNAIQESKIAPETKAAPNATKIKKKPPPKAISTQIYNFLSREVMPSFGVMSLVGLGLGLASYFLYPFGGTITRRNYETEPNYKYNLEEYGGNYGQSEEEVLSKVLQGMTSHDGKYQKDHGDYYRYQHYDGAYDAHTTKRIDARYPSTSSIYRPAENTQPAIKYRNTDFRYPEVHTTPVHYDRKRLGDHGSESVGSANRQFVVGNVPKEYPYEVKLASMENNKKLNGAAYASTEVVGQTQFERDIAQGFNFPPNSANVHNAYGRPEVSTVSRPDDNYEEIEITPTAVAVEHGPRALKVKRAVTVDKTNQRLSRFKRDSVIQVIPSKRELEEEREEMEKEEDLSNEILDIIDSALPGGEKKKISDENNEVEDFNEEKRRRQEETNTHIKESTTNTIVKNNEGTTSVSENADSSSKIEKANDGATSTSPPSDMVNVEMHSTSSPKDSGVTVEWFENSTTQKPTESFSLFNFVKKVAEIKFRLGLTILKHASEGFARYLGHVQKRINGEE